MKTRAGDEFLRFTVEKEVGGAAVAFLAGSDGGWINGQTLRANGGMV